MPFRDESAARVALQDPLERFMALYEAFAVGRTWLVDRTALRMATVCLISTPGEASALAQATRRHDAALEAGIRWYHGVSASVRILIAAQLVKHGDDPAAYLAEVERVRAMFRAVSLRSGGVYEFLAVLVLRRVLARPVASAEVARFQAIYEAMKRHHWWLTGPEDFPACAMLIGRAEEPAAIGVGTDAVFQALRRRSDLWHGDNLQTAANMLYLADVPAPEIAERFALLLAGFREQRVRVGPEQYDELAILCLLAWPAAKIVEVVLEFQGRLRAAVRWLGKAEALNLATSLTFIRLAGGDGTLHSLADAKLLLDMQALVAANSAG